MDIYFKKEYGKLYEKAENGEAIVFEYEDENGKIINQFIKRAINIKIDGNQYYDLVTPYGYGGPVIQKVTGDKIKLLKNYEQNFLEYAKKNNIVSEFVRFHPIVKNYEDFGDMYSAIYMRKTLLTKLDEEEVIQNQFSKSARKNIKRCQKSGISYKIIVAPTNLENFKKIYYSTMDRNNAEEYYYFDEEYFNSILENFNENLVLVEAIFEEKVIAAGIYFIYKDTIHVHLSGTLSEYLKMSPAYILRYAITNWGIENGYKQIHHGGGTSNSEENGLYLFKRNFATKYDVKFYIGKKIWNDDIYKKLCDKVGIDVSEPFFPAYRKK